MRLVGGVECKKGRPHTHSVAVKDQKRYLLGCSGIPSLAPKSEGAQPRTPVPEEISQLTSDCENQQGLDLSDREGSWRPRFSSCGAHTLTSLLTNLL